MDQNLEQSRQAIDRLLKNRSQAASQIWRIFGGFEPSIDPKVALNNLKTKVDVLRVDLQGEAKSLISDMENVLSKPPIPTPPSSLPNPLNGIKEVTTRLPGGGWKPYHRHIRG